MVRLRLIIQWTMAAATLLAQPALAQPDPLGLQFVTVGAPGNAAWLGDGTAGDLAIGRGEVDYSYRIGQYEFTTGQWASFMNAALDRPSNDHIPFVFAPSTWGAAATTPINQGGQRFTVPAGHDMYAAGGIDWRTCAILCNWLCHGANPNAPRSDFLSGAYDVSTFGYNGNIFTDQPAHTPGAAYYIPTWDEWLKAAHYDPNKNGPGQGGWWTYSNGSNTPLIGGPPPSMGGNGQANFGFEGPVNPYSIPLGAYSTQSPLGLFDVAGGTSEWTESIYDFGPGQPRFRYDDGSFWDSSPGYFISDSIYSVSAQFPSVSTYDLGFRIAASIPTPASAIVLGFIGAGACARGRRIQ